VLTPGFQLTELGAVIQSVIGLVPHGVVVFLPSYAFLDKVKVFWTRSGSLQKVADKKQASCPRRGPRSVLTCAF
jgi:Rad3-related DNA helicase